MTQISEFSSEYFLLDAELLEYPGNAAICGPTLHRGLQRYVKNPVVRVGGEHERLESQTSIPADTVAVPEYMYHTDEPVLVAKDETIVESFQ